MTLPPLLNPAFWFNPNPPPFLTVIDRIILVVVVAFIIVGVAAEVVRARGMDKLVKRALHRAGTLLISAGLVGLLLYAFAYERISFLSMRVLWIAWALWVGIAAWSISKYVLKEIPSMRAEHLERERIEKWLPKKKK